MEEDIKNAKDWLDFTKNAPVYAMARIHVKNLIDKIYSLQSEVERKDEALKLARKHISNMRPSGFNPITGRVIVEINEALSTKEEEK